MATAWYVQKNNRSVGPLSAKQLRELALAGKVRGDDLVRKGEEGEFGQANQIKNLFASDQAASRPTPPPPRIPASVQGALPVSSPLRTVDPSQERNVPDGTDSESFPASRSWSARVQSAIRKLVSYIPVLRQMLGDFGQQASQAGELGKLIARRSQLQQHYLPQAFAALGADVYAERRFADEFPNQIAEIDEVISQQSELGDPGTPESKSENLTQKGKRLCRWPATQRQGGGYRPEGEDAPTQARRSSIPPTRDGQRPHRTRGSHRKC